ncbi:glycoside hydrolase family 43 protein [Hymenobacter sp. B1770]|uniref:glycoside hydrolase family 43 protein n=1 Tax=Hymenobacter sp. B1770 TaxID=1718788 RepID=UPI003CF388DB
MLYSVRLASHALLAIALLGTGACEKTRVPAVPVTATPLPAASTTFQNPLLTSGPDPFVAHKDGFYYYTHTLYNQLRIWKTADMSALSGAPSTLIWTPPTTGNAAGNLWAPELFFLDGKWYLYYTAGPVGNNFGFQRTWVLENANSDPTTGTWIDKGRIFNPNEDHWAIDGTVLEQNGNRYFLWSGHNGLDGVQRIYISRMSNPWTLTGPRVELSRPQYAWESVGPPFVNEGPEILKHDNKTFLVYSASFCATDDYALGMLTASSTADPMLPSSWTKSTQPVFSQRPAARAYATGHNSFFKSKDGKEDWIIYHANSNPGEGCVERRNPRMQKFACNSDGTPNFSVPVTIYTDVVKPSGE